MSSTALLLIASLAHGAEHFEGYGFYIGDPHLHTGASGDAGSTDLGVCEGTCGAAAEMAANARANDLDWLSVTDHTNGAWAPQQQAYAFVHQIVLEAHDPEDGFVTLPGAELWFQTGSSPAGHKNLYFGASNELLAELSVDDTRWDGDGIQMDDCDAIWSWMAELEAAWGPVMLLPHHTGMPQGMGTDWRCHEGEEAARFAPAVEVYSRHGSSMACPSDYDPLWSGCEPSNVVPTALDPLEHGLRLTIIAGSDAHDTLPGNICAHDTEMPPHPYGGGLTVAVIPDDQDFDRSTLFEAIRQGDTYATTGPLLPVIVEYSADGEILGGMGDDLVVPWGADLGVELRFPSERAEMVTQVLLLTPGDPLTMQDQGGGSWSLDVTAEDVPHWLLPQVRVDGEAWYDEPCEDAGEDYTEYLWISPSWPSVAPRDTAPPDDTEPPIDSEDPSDSDCDNGIDGEEPDDGCGSSCGWGGAGPAAGLLLALLGLPWVIRRRS